MEESGMCKDEGTHAFYMPKGGKGEEFGRFEIDTFYDERLLRAQENGQCIVACVKSKLVDEKHVCGHDWDNEDNQDDEVNENDEDADVASSPP
jgi:hypothetical protein